MKIWQTPIVVALSAALMFGVAGPAGADTADITDPSNDVTTQSGASASEPRVDIRGVSFTNSADDIEVSVEVAEIAPFNDDAWTSGDLGVFVALDDPTSEADSSSFTWLLTTDENGDPIGVLFPDDGPGGCITDASTTSTTYVLHADASCARGLPRSLAFGAVGIQFTSGTNFVFDQAPDGVDMAGPVDGSPTGVTTRLAGTDRILTAVALSGDRFADGEAQAVVVAASQSFPDALAGGPLAAYSGAPMLLTGSDALDPRVADEMARVLPPGGTVYVLGGTAALSEQVVTDIRDAGFQPQRVAGISRFETAIAIADEIDGVLGDIVGEEHAAVLIADGRTFTDALIAGAAAPTIGAVVVLTDGTTMPDSTRSYLAGDGTDHTAIGTPAATAASGAHSITGANPSELSVNVADELSPIRGVVAIASQATFADALAGGPHIASLGGPLLLTDPLTLSTAAGNAIEAASGSLREVVVYGGTAAVSTAVVDQIDAKLAS